MIKNLQYFLNEGQKLTDMILDKIADGGRESLSKDELEYLDALSKKNHHLADEIEDKIYGIEKKEFKWNDNEGDEGEDDDVMEQGGVTKKLQNLADELNQMIAQEIAQDLHGDDQAIDGFLKTLLLTLSKIRKGDYAEASKYLTKTIEENFDEDSEFSNNYRSAEWYKDVIHFLDDMEQTLNEIG